MAVSAVTVAELEFGVEKSTRPEHNREGLAGFLMPFEVLSFDADAAKVYGALRADLERRGTPIGSLDLMIGAHAMALGATLVTNNLREFNRLRGLKAVNWVS